MKRFFLIALCASHVSFGIEEELSLDTDLVQSIDNGRVVTVKYLLKAGANPNACNDYGWSALALAAHIGNPKICRMLIKKGANIAAEDSNGIQPLALAAQSGSVAATKILLAAGSEVEACDKNGTTALMRVVGYVAGLDVGSLLIQYGANPEARDKNKKSVIDLACEIYHACLDDLIEDPDYIHGTEEEREIYEESARDSQAILDFLSNIQAIRAAILQNENPPLKRLKRDTENIHDAIMNRELGI